MLLILNEIKNIYFQVDRFPTWTVDPKQLLLRRVTEPSVLPMFFSYECDAKLLTCAEAAVFANKITSARLTGAWQIQDAHVVLISCLSPVLNLGFPVTSKKVISPEATASTQPAFPPLFSQQNSQQLPEKTAAEGGSKGAGRGAPHSSHSGFDL